MFAQLDQSGRNWHAWYASHEASSQATASQRASHDPLASFHTQWLAPESPSSESTTSSINHKSQNSGRFL